MAQYEGRFLADEKVWLDLYIDKARQKIITEYINVYDRGDKALIEKNRIKIWVKDVPIENWESFNSHLLTIIHHLKMEPDIVIPILYNRILTVEELSVVMLEVDMGLFKEYIHYIVESRLPYEKADELVGKINPRFPNASTKRNKNYGDIVYNSNAECIVAELLTKKNISFTRKTIQYFYEKEGEKIRTNTRPDFIFEDKKIVVYIDGYCHDIPETVIRDARQDKALKDMGYYVYRYRLPAEKRYRSNTPTELGMVVDTLVLMLEAGVEDYDRMWGDLKDKLGEMRREPDASEVYPPALGAGRSSIWNYVEPAVAIRTQDAYNRKTRARVVKTGEMVEADIVRYDAWAKGVGEPLYEVLLGMEERGERRSKWIVEMPLIKRVAVNPKV